jgi:hypothetical protein
MTRKLITIPQLALIATTRAALGAGVALLLSDRLNDDQRRAVGWTLFTVGALSTIPLALQLFLPDDQSSTSPTQPARPELAPITPRLPASVL